MSQLPQKKEEIRYCELAPDQRELYDKIINRITNEISAGGEETNRSALLMQLRKAANHPLLHRSQYTDARVNKMAEALCRVSALYSLRCTSELKPAHIF